MPDKHKVFSAIVWGGIYTLVCAEVGGIVALAYSAQVQNAVSSAGIYTAKAALQSPKFGTLFKKLDKPGL